MEEPQPIPPAMSEHLALTPDEIERARHVFTKIDANSNNAIDFLELRVAFESTSPKLAT
jgi:hypothetical protein